MRKLFAVIMLIAILGIMVQPASAASIPETTTLVKNKTTTFTQDCWPWPNVNYDVQMGFTTTKTNGQLVDTVVGIVVPDKLSHCQAVYTITPGFKSIKGIAYQSNLPVHQVPDSKTCIVTLFFDGSGNRTCPQIDTTSSVPIIFIGEITYILPAAGWTPLLQYPINFNIT